MQKKNNKETMKRVLKYIRKYTPALVLSLLLAGLTVLLTLYIPILTGNAVDLIIGKGQVDMAGIFAIMKKIAIAMIITAVGQWIMNTCNNYITYHVIRDIRTDAFAKLEILPLKYLDAHAYGDIVSRVIADVDTFADGLLMGFTQLFTGVLTILCTLGFMLVTNVPITLVVVCITPVSFLVAKFIDRQSCLLGFGLYIDIVVLGKHYPETFCALLVIRQLWATTKFLFLHTYINFDVHKLIF